MVIAPTPPPPQTIVTQGVAVDKKQRSSNLELYRIICMLMIVAHHFVVNSGLTADGGILDMYPNSANTLFLRLFGAWGKTGINCFLMITGYFMCTSKITFKKFLKLMGSIYLYKFLIFIVFLFTGYETVTLKRIVTLVMPVWGFNNNFVSCFIGFWLLIPFLSVLVQNLSQRKHQLLLVLVLSLYSLLGSLPSFNITFNYITWFSIIFFIASYIRLYPHSVFNNKRLWGWLTLLSIVLSITSILFMQINFSKGTYFLSDSNKILAVAVAICSFLWFKNMNIRYSKLINAFGAATFGVLLIHANSDAMRTWLWKDIVDVTGHYSLPLGQLVLYSAGVVIAVFIICNLIDQIRIATLEMWFFNWYDRKVSFKADRLVNRITTGK